MRLIGSFEILSKAETFRDYLYTREIESQVDPGKDNVWEIWGHDDEQLAEAKAILADFKSNSDDPKFPAAVESAGQQREKEAREYKASLKKVYTRQRMFGFGRRSIGPLTLVLMGISILVTLLCRFGDDVEMSHYFLITEYVGVGLPEIRSGQVWRLVTPIFLHLDWMHILFNMMWLASLGNAIERKHGYLYLAAFVITIGVTSNMGQFMVSGSGFGGMSGVVYGLLGYIWIRGKFDPLCGLYLRRETVIMMMIWYVLCFTGLLGGIANMAHTVGLGVGMLWGYLTARVNPHHSPR